MSSLNFQPQDVAPMVPKSAVVVSVDELDVMSPTADPINVLSRIVEVTKADTSGIEDDLEIFEFPVTRSRTSELGRPAQSTSSMQRSSSHETIRRQEKSADIDSSPRRRALNMQLPSFRSLGISSSSSDYFSLRPQTALCPSPTRRAAAQSLPLPTQDHARPQPQSFGSSPLLTPPEDADSIKWNNALLHQFAHPHGGQASMSMQSAGHVAATNAEQHRGQPLNSTSSHPSSQSDLEFDDGGDNEDLADSGHPGDDGAPLARAIRTLISAVLDPDTDTHNIHIIAQVLPQPAIDAARSKPAFEGVIEIIQASQNSDNAAYITITHAVPPKFEMKDIPTSPPATPNLAQGRDDYFGQTIFTNAATVSTYHGYKSLLNNQAPPSPNTIVAPSSTQICVLERYIPPTSAQEYDDFFDSRSHSILVDRLAELSVRGGRLLLLYPTKRGAETFMSSYLEPVLDPFLREFIFLNNLYFQLATTLGQMSAVPSMLGFEDMEDRIRLLCKAISRKASFRGGPSSTFSLIYTGKGSATLDSKTWKEWFIQQEIQRIRENIVDYHKNGGRMPPEVNHREITTGVLARQVVDGISGSDRVSGGVPLELGMFVIERTKF